MKYSIIINPYSDKSDAALHALKFIKVLLSKNHSINTVFFYGYAVKYAFFNNKQWKQLADQNISLLACSTIAESYDAAQALSHFKIQGLGQWMQALLESDKTVEFV